jgi:hypothetical protein
MSTDNHSRRASDGVRGSRESLRRIVRDPSNEIAVRVMAKQTLRHRYGEEVSLS